MIIRRNALSYNDMNKIEKTPGDYLVAVIYSNGVSEVYNTTKELIDSLEIEIGHYMAL